MRGLVRFYYIARGKGKTREEVFKLLGKREHSAKGTLTDEKDDLFKERENIFDKIKSSTCENTILICIKKLMQLGLSYAEITLKSGLDPQKFFDLDVENKGKFVVYKATLDGEIIYIGEGAFDRLLHVTSGCSHVYGLNYLHFLGVSVETEIVSFHTSKQEALEVETSLIKTHQPLLNRQGNNTSFNFHGKFNTVLTDTIYSLCAPITKTMLKDALTTCSMHMPPIKKKRRISNPSFSYEDLLKRKNKD